MLESRILKKEDKEDFLNFIEHEREKNSNRNRPRPWLINTANFNSSDNRRQCIGTFYQGRLVGVCACNMWSVWPFTVWDTLVLEYGLSAELVNQLFDSMADCYVQHAESHKRFTIWGIRDLRQANALHRSGGGFWKTSMQRLGYIYHEYAIIPANTTPNLGGLNVLLGDEKFPVDMHIGVYMKDPNCYPKDWQEKITYDEDTY